MRIRTLSILRSPDEGAGAGGSVAPASEPAGTVDVSPSDAGEPEFDASGFAAALEQSVDARFAARGGKLFSSTSNDAVPEVPASASLEDGDRALPGEVTGAPAAAAAPANPPANQTPAADDSAKNPEPPVADAPKQPDQPPPMATLNINGRILTAEQVVQMATYYDQRAAELEKAEKTITERMDSSDMVILRYLQEKPGLRDKFLEFAGQEHPDVKNAFIETEMGKRMGALEQQWQARAQAENQARQQAEQAQRTAAFQSAAREVEALALDKAKALGLPADVVSEVGYVAHSLLNQGALPFTREAVTQFVINQLEKKAAWVKSIQDQQRASYIDKKRSAPPPPPTGGSAPVISPKSPGFGKELRRLVTDDLARALGSLGQ